MIIYLNQKGRLGHQLIHLLVLEAYALKYNKNFYYKSFSKKYKGFFEIKNTKNIPTQVFSYWFIKIIYTILRSLKIKSFKICSFYFFINTDNQDKVIYHKEIEKLFSVSYPYVITDFMLSDVDIFMQYADEIGNMIDVTGNIKNKTNILFKNIRKHFKTTIAIHIRHTDFKTFVNGAYYFSTNEYRKVLDRFIKVLNLNKKDTAVIICSDEILDISDFENYHTFYEKRSPIEDFSILKEVDYIISTKSLFGLCANILGNNFLYQVTNPEYLFTKNNIYTYKTLLLSEYGQNLTDTLKNNL